MRHWARCLAIIGFAAAVPAAADDLTITSKVTSDKNPPTTATSYMSGDHIRMVQGDGQEFMMDFKAGEMTTIDHKKKEYSVVTRQDMLAMQARMQEQMNSPEMKKAQEQMKSLPPEMQKKMEAMMGGAMAVDVQKTGTSRKVAGYNCENWTITIGQFSKTEQCLTSEIQYPVQAWDSFKEFTDSMRTMAQSMGPMAKGMAQVTDKFKEMRGIPVYHSTSINVMGKSSVTTSEVTEVKKGPIPPTAWAIPAGYTKVVSPMGKALEKKTK